MRSNESIVYLLAYFATALSLVSATPLQLSKRQTSTSPDDYTRVVCTNPVITDAATNPVDKWNQTFAEQAWTAAVNSWTAHPNPGGLNFSMQISNFFHGPESMNCGTIDDHNGCSNFVQCSQTNYVAGYLILNSLTQLEAIILNWYDAISRVEADIIAQVGNVAASFAPVPKNDDGLKIALDILQMGYAIGAAGIWNSALKGLTFFKNNANTLGVLKDSVNGVVGGGLSLIKDLGASPALAKENTISSNVKAVIDVWYNTVDQLNTALFNGSTSSINTIHTIIQDGQLLENAFKLQKAPEIQQQLERAIFSSLIPNTWALSENQIYPVVVDVKVACGPKVDFSKIVTNNRIDPAAIHDWACVDGNIYYLLGARGTAATCITSPDGDGFCSDNDLPGLPGIPLLNGNDWGGIKINDFITGAVNTYAANGNRNGVNPVLPGVESKTLDSIINVGIAAPNIIVIPVCGSQEVVQNWSKMTPASSAPNNRYPCN